MLLWYFMFVVVSGYSNAEDVLLLRADSIISLWYKKENKYLSERLEKFKESFDAREQQLTEIAKNSAHEQEQKKIILTEIHKHWNDVKKKAKEFEEEKEELVGKEKPLSRGTMHPRTAHATSGRVSCS